MTRTTSKFYLGLLAALLIAGLTFAANQPSPSALPDVLQQAIDGKQVQGGGAGKCASDCEKARQETFKTCVNGNPELEEEPRPPAECAAIANAEAKTCKNSCRGGE
jgi:hypothetical protein